MAAIKFPIEASHIMMFARAVGDDNPLYYDEDYANNTEAGSVIAPPTFVQASAQFDPEYFLRPKIGKPWFGSGKQASGLKPLAESDEKASDGGGGLHAEQHYEYHRHPKPGDILTATLLQGKTWEKEGKRSGKLVFTESITQYRDQNGDLVVTATGVGVTTERPVDQ